MLETGLTRKRVVIEILGIIAVVVFFLVIFRTDLKKDQPVPELSDKEVSGLLEALLLPDTERKIPTTRAAFLPDTTKISAMRVVFLKDGADVSVSVRVRIDRDRLDKVVRASWMESHRVAAAEIPGFPAYRMMLPPMYEIGWWEVLPLRPEDERFYMRLEQPQHSYPGSILAVIRKVGQDIDLYFVRSSHSDYLPPVVLEAMRRGFPFTDTYVRSQEGRILIYSK
jgi:hypothetical protein